MPSLSLKIVIPGTLAVLACLAGCQGHRGGCPTGACPSPPGYVMLPGPTSSATPHTRQQALRPVPREQYWQTPQPHYAEPLQRGTGAHEPLLPVPAPPAEELPGPAGYPSASYSTDSYSADRYAAGSMNAGRPALTPVPDHGLNPDQFGHAPFDGHGDGGEQLLSVRPLPRRKLLPSSLEIPNVFEPIGRGLRNGYDRLRNRDEVEPTPWESSTPFESSARAFASAPAANAPQSLADYSGIDPAPPSQAGKPATAQMPVSLAERVREFRQRPAAKPEQTPTLGLAGSIPAADYGGFETAVPRPVKESPRTNDAASRGNGRGLQTLDEEAVVPQIQPRREAAERTSTLRPTAQPARVSVPPSISPVPRPSSPETNRSSPGPMLFVP